MGFVDVGGVCMCVHMCLSPSDSIVQPNLRTSEARAEFSDLAAGSCQTRYEFNYPGGRNQAETEGLVTRSGGGGLSSGGLASVGTCHIIFHPLSPESGSYWKD